MQKNQGWAQHCSPLWCGRRLRLLRCSRCPAPPHCRRHLRRQPPLPVATKQRGNKDDEKCEGCHLTDGEGRTARAPAGPGEPRRVLGRAVAARQRARQRARWRARHRSHRHRAGARAPPGEKSSCVGSHPESLLGLFFVGERVAPLEPLLLLLSITIIASSLHAPVQISNDGGE